LLGIEHHEERVTGLKGWNKDHEDCNYPGIEDEREASESDEGEERAHEKSDLSNGDQWAIDFSYRRLEVFSCFVDRQSFLYFSEY
jgi:hypothetical protein